VVPGNVWADQGAEYMLHILDLLKRPQIPVYTGAAGPLVHSVAMAREYGRRWGALEFMGAFAHNDPAAVIPAWAGNSARKAHREAAVQFLISEIERQPGEVTILAIGPMTNIALALRLKPGIETKIKRIVFMGGNLKPPGNASAMAEFNFWFDPEAARIVLRSRIPQKVMFGARYLQYRADPQGRVRSDRGRAHAHHRPLPRGSGQPLPRLPPQARRHRLHVGFAGGGLSARPRIRHQVGIALP
jgi:inosine-uridine nucleoside N-ribohydrolase